MAEDAAVNSLIVTVIGWLIFRCLGEGENTDRRLVVLLICFEISGNSDRQKKPSALTPPTRVDELVG
jgi:hypothetical protein